LPFRRIEANPGEETQVDLGVSAPIIDENGRWRRSHIFRIALSHSRNAYSKVVDRQTTEKPIGALKTAFRHFGGSSKNFVIDNLHVRGVESDRS
jgi:hypothetical protein